MSLRRAYLIVTITVGVFFLVYLLQASGLYRRSITAQRAVQHTHAVIYCIERIHLQLWKKQTERLRQASDPAATAGAAPDGKMQRIMDSLLLLTRDNPLQHERAQVFNSLVGRRSQQYGGALASGSMSSIAMLDDSITQFISMMEQTEDSLLRHRTQRFERHSNDRFLFSIGGYVVISIFLVISLYILYRGQRNRARIEREARLTGLRYQTLVEASGFTTVVLDADRRILFASRNVEQLTGYTPEELIGQSAQDYVPDERIERSGPVDTEHIKSYERSINMKGGRQKWIAFRIFPLPGADDGNHEMQLVVWDVTAEKHLEIELHLQQKLLQNIVDNIPSAVAIKDLTGKYILVNRRVEENLSRPASQILGRLDSEVLHDLPSIKRIHQADQRVQQTRSMITSEEVLEYMGRKEYHWTIRLPLFNEAGDVTHICVVSNNITERKEAELKLLRATRSAERARSAQESFLANMSHEIRTPMNGIVGMSNLLLGTRLDNEQHEYASNILESARHLLVIINDILDFSKIRSGKFRFDHIPFKLRHVLRKALYPLQLKSEEKMIGLKIEVDPDVPEVLIGDPLRLQQVLINLVGNAIKFTDQGGVDISVRCSDAEGQKGRIILHTAVRDSGIGIAEDKLQYIFESFTQNNVATSRKYGGTGLGLAIVKQLVELQGGTVGISSELGKGSVFTFSLPYEVGREIAAEATARQAIQAGDSNLLAGVRILLAEDNLINQKVAGTTLQRQGASVTICSNGRMAVEELQRAAYDVILMDLQMPEMDGYTATRHIRQVMRNATPIIAMTADALKGEAEKCFDAGMNGYISKPFEPRDLYAEILKWTRTPAPDEEEDENPETMNEDRSIIDFSYLYELSGNDAGYVSEVIGLFLGTMPEGLQQLEHHVRNTRDWEAIYRQAHFLKSSASVIRIRDVYENLTRIEALAKEQTGYEEIETKLDSILETFREAEPLLKAEQEKPRVD